MSMTMAQALAAARVRLDETDAAGWGDAEIRAWINEAVRDVARKTEALMTRAVVSVSAGDQDITMPTDILRVQKVEWTEDGNDKVYTLELIDFVAADSVWWTDQAITESRPRMFTMRGYGGAHVGVLYPKPSIGGDLIVHYYAVSSDLATDNTDDGETLAIPAGFEDLVLDYVAYLALRRDRDPRWKEHKQSYDENLSGMIEQTRRWTDQAGSLTKAGYPVADWVVNPGWY